MMYYIASVFEDAVGQRIDLEFPVTTDTDTSPAQGSPIILGRPQSIQFFMEQANRAYLKANEKKPSSVGYPSGRFVKINNVASQEMLGKAALVNPNLHNTLYPGAQEPHITHEHPVVARLEVVVARSRDTLN
ncbi:hypothetical protein E2C01_053280 [Portunus trituberculatus]|uniref:Uncharacterized protein n=1 Tax=Portunus trituberculatus TaxID=210409 RepID=A0A5B7GP29_PORTR|nr:hypothetical protein [Portunus trituberculatus]